jgi:hypothetical protein
MAHFVKFDENNIVLEIIVVDNFVLNQNSEEISGNLYLNNLFKDNIQWKQTSFNTRGGVYYEANSYTPSQDQSKAFRKNYAGIGYYYDSIRDAFIPPKPFESWTLDEFSCLWNPPIPYPNDSKLYQWNEDILNWEEINF